MELTSIISSARIHSRLIDRIAYASDASYFRLIPQVVVQPDSIGEIQSLFQYSQQSQIPMTFRAGGTSLSGQAVTDGILVDISKYWDRYQVEYGGNAIRTQPGIVGGSLNRVLKSYGRRIGPDPASIDACMIGGILSNNSSGMCCGITENSYRTIRSMTVVLPDGFVIDTAAIKADQLFDNERPQISKGLLDIKRRIQSNPLLVDRISKRYQMKNTMGYSLNSFIDFETPLDIFTHLMIGSEGTLGFIAEAVLNTLPDYPYKYTGQIYFKNVQDAAAAIYPITKSGARAAEIMDRASLRSVENLPGVSDILRQLPENAAAILVEYQAEDLEGMKQFQKESERLVKRLRLIHDVAFTDDPAEQNNLWKTRKGIIPSVGAMRPSGTTSLIEDVVFPVQHLAGAVADLHHLFDDHGYSDGVIFGHAKDGNLHFLLNQDFDAEDEVRRFDGFIQELVELVRVRYDGSLKAEHSTGRNMAPFLEAEWGADAYAIMRDIKSLFDPQGMLNPGVMINDDPNAHITNLKSLSLVAPEIDKCIECGFCESKCPSRRLTLTPRQRIVVQREIARQLPPGSDSLKAASLMEDFNYAGIETCAADGLCATACPVGINTGDYIKGLRAESVKDEKTALWLSDHFFTAEKVVGMGVRLGHIAENVIGVNGVKSVSVVAEKMIGSILPKWNGNISSPGNISHEHASNDPTEFIYFPSCISRQLGQPKNSHLKSLADTLIVIANRASISLQIPEQTEGHCCGMPFASKGYTTAYEETLHKTLIKFWEWSNHGEFPIVIDTTSCTHTLRTCNDNFSIKDKRILGLLKIIDNIEFLNDFVLPKLDVTPLDEEIILHPNCSARKLELDIKLTEIAKRCAKSVTIPLHLGCCGFAGDRGLLFPELTASATRDESAEVLLRDYDGYYSSNITCEIGMSGATGKDYLGIVYLVERASRK